MIIVYCINEKARTDSVDLFCEEHYWIQIMTRARLAVKPYAFVTILVR